MSFMDNLKKVGRQFVDTGSKTMLKVGTKIHSLLVYDGTHDDVKVILFSQTKSLRHCFTFNLADRRAAFRTRNKTAETEIWS
jgi:hypothetical protein